jgi:hypothetical protein
VQLVLRQCGGLIRELTIGDILVLTSAPGSEIEPWKLDGTITMCPAGASPHKPQHGDSRLTIYNRSFDAGNVFELSGLLRLRNLGHIKRFTFLPHGLKVLDDIVNLGPRRRHLSLGQHFYLPLLGIDQLDGVRWIDPSGLDKVVSGRLEDGRPISGTMSDFIPALLRGDTVVIDHFGGSAILEIPGVGRVLLTATATKNGVARPVSIWIWHRPGSKTFSFEPVAGVGFDSTGRLRHDLIGLKPNESVQLTCSIVLP